MNDRELAVLRVVRLKGRPTLADLAEAAAISEQEAGAAARELVASQLCQEANDRVRLTREGRDKLEELLAQEREGIDSGRVRALYERFTPLNGRFKQLAHRWQERDGEPNDHGDAAYDQAILDDLAVLDGDFQPLLEEIAALAPRLGPYPGRFRRALEKVQGGDHSWFLKPLIDSYHTIWFELHEDLIGLAGLDRASEAAAGRAE
jgi:pyruvate,orthophosphate dikinase